MRILAVGRLSAELTFPEGPHFSPPLESGLGRIGMCMSRLPEALWPTEELARLPAVTCSFRAVSEVTSHSAGSIASRASLVLHVRR